MLLQELYGVIAAKLSKELETIAFNYHGFPFHTFAGIDHADSDISSLHVGWSTDSHGRDIVSYLSGKIEGPWQNRFFMQAYPRRIKKSYPGDTQSNWESWKWRQDRHYVELSGTALWPILECHADWDKVVRGVLTT